MKRRHSKRKFGSTRLLHYYKPHHRTKKVKPGLFIRWERADDAPVALQLGLHRQCVKGLHLSRSLSSTDSPETKQFSYSAGRTVHYVFA